MTSLIERTVLSQLRQGEQQLIERLDRIIELLEAMSVVPAAATTISQNGDGRHLQPVSSA